MPKRDRGEAPDPKEAQLDDQLMARLARGEPEALGEAFQRHGRMVYALLGRYGRGLDAGDLEDLRQEVFLTLYRTAARYRAGDGTMRSWLCGIAIRTARTQARKKWWRSILLGRGGGPTPAELPRGAALEAPSERRLIVREALRTLPAGQQEVLILNVVEGLSGDEIAVALGVAPNTVWTRLHRARAALREALAGIDLSTLGDAS